MLISPIYLAGGMRDNWRSLLTEAFPEHEFFDPSTHGLDDEKLYTAWDLAHIRKAETVFAYMSADNPSGFGLSMEIGYAHALGKRIIFVDAVGHPRKKYFGMVRAVADETYDCIGDAINAWRSPYQESEKND
jgi:nucleoside 2-deoxyribosyltransferase